MLAEGGHWRSQFRRNQRQLVFAAEQFEGSIGKIRPAELEFAGDDVDGKALDLGLAGFPEDGGNREAADQGDQ